MQQPSVALLFISPFFLKTKIKKRKEGEELYSFKSFLLWWWCCCCCAAGHRRPNNYAKPLQHLQLPSKSPPLPPVMMTYPSSVDHSAVGGMDPAASSGQHSSTSSPLDTQQSLLNLQLGAAEYLTYLYLPPAPQELDEQLQRDQEASSSAATSHRKPTNTHQDGTPEPSEDDQKVTPPPYAFDPYRFRSVKSTQYYPKSRLDSEADWIPIESPWPGHNYDNITE